MHATNGNSQAVERLGQTFTGPLLTPASPGYDEARKLHNGAIDKHPALIAQCRTVADIVDAVKFAREHELEIAVRGGGHNVAGRAAVDGRNHCAIRTRHPESEPVLLRGTDQSHTQLGCAA